MAELFEPGGRLYGQAALEKGTLAITEAQRLRRQLVSEKAKVLTGESVEVNLDTATLTEVGGSTYLLPVAFVDALRTGKVMRQGARPQQLLEPIDGPLEYKALNWERDTEPIYNLHTTLKDGSKMCWPVYGYGADYGYGYHTTPLLGCRGTELPGWEDCEWLCRCAQCGRELPPSYFFLNTSGRLKATCRGCTSTNNLVDKIFHKAQRHRSEDELKLLVDTRHWYEALWRRNLCPRGDYAAHCLGAEDIKERMAHATKHRRGSAPRRPNVINPHKLQTIYNLIEETTLVDEAVNGQ